MKPLNLKDQLYGKVETNNLIILIYEVNSCFLTTFYFIESKRSIEVVSQ